MRVVTRNGTEDGGQSIDENGRIADSVRLLLLLLFVAAIFGFVLPGSVSLLPLDAIILIYVFVVTCCCKRHQDVDSPLRGSYS